jgi:hypothetical protein
VIRRARIKSKEFAAIKIILQAAIRFDPVYEGY